MGLRGALLSWEVFSYYRTQFTARKVEDLTKDLDILKIQQYNFNCQLVLKLKHFLISWDIVFSFLKVHYRYIICFTYVLPIK